MIDLKKILFFKQCGLATLKSEQIGSGKSLYRGKGDGTACAAVTQLGCFY